MIERHGKPIAAIISVEDLKRLEEIEDALDSAVLRRAVEENDGFVTLESILANRHARQAYVGEPFMSNSLPHE